MTRAPHFVYDGFHNIGTAPPPTEADTIIARLPDGAPLYGRRIDDVEYASAVSWAGWSRVAEVQVGPTEVRILFSGLKWYAYAPPMLRALDVTRPP